MSPRLREGMDCCCFTVACLVVFYCDPVPYPYPRAYPVLFDILNDEGSSRVWWPVPDAHGRGKEKMVKEKRG